jgi:hypothetical protein
MSSQLLSALVGSISEVDLEQSGSGLSSLYDIKASRCNSKSSAANKSRWNGNAKKSK